MSAATRRQFLATLALSGAGAVASARQLKTIGAQLYTLRSIIDEKPLDVLKTLEQIGYREVEVIRANIDKIWPSLKQTSLKPVSIHFDTDLFTRRQEELAPALDDARKRGFSYVVCPYIAPADRGGEDMMKRLADTLNKAGARCRDNGLKLCYHNHAFEFAPNGSSTLLNVLMKASDPKLVGLELDIMWARVAGVDPISVLKEYKGRVHLMHLKNVASNVEKQYNEKVEKSAFAEVGKGVIDIPPVLKAAESSGVAHFFVEQDQTPGNPLDSLRGSYEYLQKLNF